MCDHFAYTYVSRDFVVLDITYPRKYKNVRAFTSQQKLSADGAHRPDTIKRYRCPRESLSLRERSGYLLLRVHFHAGWVPKGVIFSNRSRGVEHDSFLTAAAAILAPVAPPPVLADAAAALLAPAAPPPVLAERPPPPRSPCNSSDAACARRCHRDRPTAATLLAPAALPNPNQIARVTCYCEQHMIFTQLIARVTCYRATHDFVALM